jgi:RNA polymerase sigma-70 factor, ECF subfamily
VDHSECLESRRSATIPSLVPSVPSVLERTLTYAKSARYIEKNHAYALPGELECQPMSPPMSPPEVTELLRRISDGDKQAEEELYPEVYRELRKIAASYMRRERPDHTLQPTALVNEAYGALAAQHTPWESRAHFFGVAAQIMRRILVDYARKRRSRKRGGEVQIVEFKDSLPVSDDQWELISDLDDELEVLRKFDPRQARIVELRFFSGMTEEEIAEVLGITSRTVKREWKKARAWLYGRLKQ